MKRLLITFILLVSSVSWAAEPVQLARMNAAIIGGGAAAAAAGCTTANDSAFYDFTAAADSGPDYCGVGYNTTCGTKATFAATSTVTAYLVNVRNNAQSGTMTAALYTDNTDTVGTVIAGTTATLSVSSTGVKELVLSTPKTGLSGVYWLNITSADGIFQLNWASHAGNAAQVTSTVYDNYGWNVGVMGCAE